MEGRRDSLSADKNGMDEAALLTFSPEGRGVLNEIYDYLHKLEFSGCGISPTHFCNSFPAILVLALLQSFKLSSYLV